MAGKNPAFQIEGPLLGVSKSERVQLPLTHCLLTNNEQSTPSSAFSLPIKGDN